MARFTDYFEPYVEAWEYFFSKQVDWRADEKKVAVEIGSYEGSSAIWITNNLLKAPDSELYCIDAWGDVAGERHFENFQKNVLERTAASKLRIVRDLSFNALLALNRKRLKADLLYVDGSHSAPDVLSDLVLGFALVKVGGVIVCDDYTWDDPKHGGDDLAARPKLAIDAFTTIYARKVRLHRAMPLRQIFLTKTAD